MEHPEEEPPPYVPSIAWTPCSAPHGIISPHETIISHGRNVSPHGTVLLQ